MWTCLQCGESNDPAVSSCGNCGRPSENAPTAQLATLRERPCPGCGRLVGAELTDCPVCEIPVDSGRRRPRPSRSGGRRTAVIVACLLGAVAVVLAIALPSYIRSKRLANEQMSIVSLRILATAEADFRANDRDRNYVNDYWTGDVAGLYCIGKDRPIELIPKYVAAADSNPIRASSASYPKSIISYAAPNPLGGYWFWALRWNNAVQEAYQQGTGGMSAIGSNYNMHRFGFMAYPADPGSANELYIVNEEGPVLRRTAHVDVRPSEFEPPGPVTASGFTAWPAEAELRTIWDPLD